MGMLTEFEKWHFDLQGYLLLKDVVPPEDVARMVVLCDEWHALSEEELPAPMRTYQDANTQDLTPRAINHIEYADEVFQRLVLNPEIMRVVLATTRNCPQLLGSALTRNTKEDNSIPFHSGFEGGIRNPANDYQAANGEVFATFLNAAVSLVDVPAGTGFVCIPGSHKSNFAAPDNLTIDDEPPLVINIPAQAGDVVIFTEALRHGGRKWTGDEPRRTAFCRYCTAYASWTPTHGPMEDYRDRLSEEVWELHQRCGYTERKKVVDRLLAEQ
jgi:phytanoyl-CoA dioxygenase PhyH